MNNRYSLLLLTTLVWLPLAHAFEDKSALTNIELGLRKVSKALGLVAGAGVGGVSGSTSGATFGLVAGYAAAPSSANEVSKVIGEAAGFITGEGTILGGAVVGGTAGLGTGLATGGYLGYKGLGYVAVRSLAAFHGVSYAEELVSQFYDINLSQYGMLLDAAHDKANLDYLNELIGKIYSQRFGANWKQRLVALYDLYKERVSLFSKTYFAKSKSEDEKDFVRMMELGAAMGNLYFKTKPNIKNIVKDGTRMYQALGLL